MDEVDSIGSARMEGGSSGGDSEVQRTMLELLNQLDGFEATNKIKVHFYRYQETNLIIQWDQIWVCWQLHLGDIVKLQEALI